MEDKVIDNKEITLKEVILNIGRWYRYCLSRWVTIISFVIIGGILGYFYARFKKPIYTATTTFVLEEGDKAGGGLGQYAGLASMVGVDLGGGAGGIFQGDNILELYKSRKMIEKTLLTDIVYNGKKQLLIDRYIGFNELRKKWDKDSKLKNLSFKAVNVSNFDASTLNFTRLQDSIIGVIVIDINKNYMTVSKPDIKLSIIKAEIKAKDEIFAKAFNNVIVKNVNDFYVQTKTKKSTENVAILQEKTDSVRAVMNGAIYSAAAIADATPNLNITRQVQRAAPVQRSNFSAETNKAILSEMVKNLELSKMSLLKEKPLIQVIDQPVFPLEVEKLGKVKGIVAGAFLAGFLTVIVLLINKILKALMA